MLVNYIFASLLLLTATRATDYCHKDLCPHNMPHIGCLNYGDFDESCGEGTTILPFTTQLRGQLLSNLNGFRNAIALGRYKPYLTAGSMATMRWHPELAGLAKFAVRRCENLEDYCGNTDEFKYSSYIFGSTKWLHQKKAPRAVLDFVLKYWIDDHVNCNMSHIDAKLPPKDGLCRGYFTQLVQDQAAHIGCAMLQRRSGSDGDIQFQYSLLCQFSRGKIASQPVYRISSVAAARCYSGVHSTYRGLCAPEEHVNPNALQRKH